jgi:peptidoglycan LD-endopeptidase LytH
MKKLALVVVSILIVIALVTAYFMFLSPTSSRGTAFVVPFIRHPEDHQDWVVPALSSCNNAPFLLPSSGLIGYLWADTFKIGHLHQGIDIFGGTDIGVTPVYAAYDGYLTRLSDWKSSLIIRIPSDPLQPDRQIWTYYTHMADPQGNSFIDALFPAGTSEVFVKAGTFLGYQGDYSGDVHNPVGVHLHFSIVKDDGNGKFLNELDITNTLDPSPYFGLSLNKNDNPVYPINCRNTGAND